MLKDITVRVTELNILLTEPFYFEKLFVLSELILNNDVVLNTVNSSDRSCKRAVPRCGASNQQKYFRPSNGTTRRNALRNRNTRSRQTALALRACRDNLGKSQPTIRRYLVLVLVISAVLVQCIVFVVGCYFIKQLKSVLDRFNLFTELDARYGICQVNILCWL